MVDGCFVISVEVQVMDIVERLRKEIAGYTDAPIENAEADMREAADQIERLRKALKEISDLFEYHAKTYDHVPSNLYLMAKIARAAMKENE